MSQHPLALQQTAVTKELNLSKYVGQVALGVAVTLTVRYVVSKWDLFSGKIKKV